MISIRRSEFGCLWMIDENISLTVSSVVTNGSSLFRDGGLDKILAWNRQRCVCNSEDVKCIILAIGIKWDTCPIFARITLEYRNCKSFKGNE